MQPAKRPAGVAHGGVLDPNMVVRVRRLAGCRWLIGSIVALAPLMLLSVGEMKRGPAMMWALEIIGTAVKPKVPRVLPDGRRASARCRSMRRRSRSAISCFSERHALSTVLYWPVSASS